jgi:hypothetical protein
MQKLTVELVSELFEDSFQRVVAALNAKSHGQRFHLDKVRGRGLLRIRRLSSDCGRRPTVVFVMPLPSQSS